MIDKIVRLPCNQITTYNMAKNKTLDVKGIEVTMITDRIGDFISLTDMLRQKTVISLYPTG